MAIFDKKKCLILKKGKLVMKGVRTKLTGLWIAALLMPCILSPG